jgi:hypothetical protein
MFLKLYKGCLFVLKPRLAATTPRRLHLCTVFGTQLASNLATAAGVSTAFELGVRTYRSSHNVAFDYERIRKV